MRRNIHYKPSKSASILSGVIACAMGVFGLFTIPSIGAMIGFKAIWCLMAFGMGIYNFLLAAGVVKYNGGYEITWRISSRRSWARSPTSRTRAQRAASPTPKRGSRSCRPFTTAASSRKRSIRKNAGTFWTGCKRKERGQWEKF